MKRVVKMHLKETEQKIIKSAEANMHLEGYEISEQVKQDCCEMIKGEVSVNDVICRYVEKHSCAG